MNNWGTISPYIGSYYYHLDSSVSISDFVVVSPISFISNVFWTAICSFLLKILNPHSIITLGVTISCTGLFCSSFITNPYLFCWIFGLSYGMLTGMIFVPTVWIIWNNLPDNKARTSGILLAFYTFGPVPFSILFTMIANPYDDPPETTKNEGVEKEKIFGEFVSYRVPMTIRWMILAYTILCVIGLLCLPQKWISESQNQKIERTMTLNDIIRNGKFWNLLFLMASSMSNMSYVQNTYKIIGMLHINDDHFISFIGSTSFFISSFGRVLYGVILDKYSWKRVMVITYIIEILFGLTFSATFNSRFWYGVYIIVFAFLNTSMYNSVMIRTTKDFEKDKWVFNFVSAGMLIAFTIPYMFEKIVTPYIGYFWTIIIITAITVTAMFQSIFHPIEDEKYQLIEQR